MSPLSFSFYVTALLRYNSHAIQFIHLVYNSVVCNIHKVCNHQHNLFLSPQKEIPYSLAVIPYFSPSLRQPLIYWYFLSLYISLFWTFHVNGIIQCGLLWLASSHNFFSVHLCCSLYHYFIPFYDWVIFISLYGYTTLI